MSAQALEQSVLESKDKEQLLAIAKALGVKASTRNKKADIIAQILEMTGPPSEGEGAAPRTEAERREPSAPARPAPSRSAAPDEEPPAEWELAVGDDAAETSRSETNRPAANRPAANGGGAGRGDAGTSGGGRTTPTERPAAAARPDDRSDRQDRDGGQQDPGGQPGGDDDGEGRSNRRRRRRRKAKGGEQATGDEREFPGVESEPSGGEPTPAVESRGSDNVQVAGHLDLRDEGYGFLRINGYLPSRDDAYVPVKLARQFGLRKGDHLTGVSRPASRNEKNPALLAIHTVNGADPEVARDRPRFEDLTALFPDERLYLENPSDPADMTARVIDLVAPIGKGQRGIIVSPPKAGKTTIMKTIAKAIERNNPEITLMVLLIDERPEEVTDMRRTVKGEVIASTFDRPSEEHTQVAEMTIERAKRLVETGADVVIILDGITRLSRAYNLAAPTSGKILSGGIDAGALYPPKKFFGAARNVEEGGSLTILATALVETNSRMDDAIFEEFKGTGNMELRLDRRLAERRVYPAIDVDASSTRHEELLFDRKQLQMVWKLRRVLSGLAADGNAAPGLELLTDRLRTFRTNAEFLDEIARQPAM